MKYNVCLEGDVYPAAMLVKELKEGALGGKKWFYKGSSAYEINKEGFAGFDRTHEKMIPGYQPSQEEKKHLMAIFRDLAAALLPYQDKRSHMWRQVADQGGGEGNYLETSGSSMIAYSFLKGASLCYLEAGYRELGEQIFDGICSEMLCEKNGELLLGGICLVAGLGGQGQRRDGSYAYYISEPVAENDGKGVGPFLLAYGEL